MGEKQLLIFRWGAQQYGIPIADVSGVIGNPQISGLSTSVNVERVLNLQDKPILISDTNSGFKVEDNKPAIILHSNGVQIVIMVDEFITEMSLSNEKESEYGGDIAAFQIFKIGHISGAYHKARRDGA